MTQVTFKKSDKTVEWVDQAESLLELGEDLDIDLPFGCREGNCTMCQQPILSGEIEYPNGHNGIPDDGHILLCCSRPKEDSDVVIDA